MTNAPDPEQPPLLPSWRAWYWLVLAALALEIIGFTFITRYYT